MGNIGNQVYAARKAEIKAVLTDLAMPVMDGVALVRALKQMNPRVKIIASTGLGMEAQEVELNALGVSVILKKPYPASAILTVLRKVLDEAEAGK